MSKKRSSKNIKKPLVKKNVTEPKRIPLKRVAFWKAYWLQGLALLILSVALYGYSTSFGFVLDDKIVLSENNFVKQGWQGLGKIFSTESFVGFLGEQQDLVVGARYRPLSIATFAVEYEFWGLNPKISHFINLLLYGLSSLLLFRVLGRLLPRKEGQSPWLSLSFLATLLFVVHPIHTEVVANIKGRDEILALLLSLAALYYTFKYLDRSKPYFLLLSGLTFWLGMMAKENTITFLAVIPLSLYFFSTAGRKQLLLSTAPLIAAIILYLIIRVNIIGYLLDSGQEVTGIMSNPFYGISPGEKYATILYTLGAYLKLLLFPHPLTHDYYPYQVPIMDWGKWIVWLSLTLYTTMTVFAVRNFRKGAVASWSILYFLCTLSIVSNLVFPIGAPMNERFVYMPSVGICLLLVYWILEKLPLMTRGRSGKWLAYTVLGLLIMAYAAKTVSRIPAWKDEMALNRAAIEVSVNSARANSYMGYSLYQAGLSENDLGKKQALFTEALPYVDKALSIYPEYTDALTAKSGLLAGNYQLNGQLEEVLEGFYQIQSAKPIAFVDTYLEYLNPRADTRLMVNFYHRAGYDLLAREKNNYPYAIKYLNYGLSLAPNDIRLLEDMAEVQYLAGQAGAARQFAERALYIDQNSERALKVLEDVNR
jgi:hypothetical protein